MIFKKLGLEEFDKMHEEEFLLLQELIDAIKEEEEYTKKLHSLIAHLKKHFEYEEKLMEKYNCPMKLVHKEEHKKILKSLNEMLNLLSHEVLEKLDKNFIPQLKHHLETIEPITANYIKEVKKDYQEK